MRQKLKPLSKSKISVGQGERASSERSLEDWLSLLEARHPSEIDLGLERIAKVRQALKLTRPASKTITVAGTNGKGSAVAIMEAILLRKGRRVGAYTSPHLLNYNERVRIDGQSVDDQVLCQAFAKIEAARGAISLSYFEFGTLAALLIFAQAGLDVALLEVGLGGRLDAVNIVDADVGIITSIALDHESWLGNSREQIALEKAGIARANKPLVCADSDMPTTLLPQLKILGARPYVLGGSEFCYRSEGEKITLHCADNSGERHTFSDLPLPQVPLPSALCAVQALLVLGESITEQTVQQVFSTTRLPGRLQRLRLHDKNIILDVAHNPAAAQLLAQNLAAQQSGAIHALFSVMADKDIAGIVAPLSHLVSHWHIAELPSISRAAKSADIVNVVQSCESVDGDAECSAYNDIEAAMAGALKQMQPEDTLLGFGSFFTVAAILATIEASAQSGDIARK
jgi:dihydrofolate synthase/folylpolyglutamate synthase